jgi:hypothetical protein
VPWLKGKQSVKTGQPSVAIVEDKAADKRTQEDYDLFKEIAEAIRIHGQALRRSIGQQLTVQPKYPVSLPAPERCEA